MTWPKFVGGVFAASVSFSIAALLLDRHDLGLPATWPALGIAGWAFAGHLVTLDDDAPGGFSNAAGSKDLWRSSLRELALELVALLGVVALLLSHVEG